MRRLPGACPAGRIERDTAWSSTARPRPTLAFAHAACRRLPAMDAAEGACGMCGACGAEPPWAPEALAAVDAAERDRVLARVDGGVARFVAGRRLAEGARAAGAAMGGGGGGGGGAEERSAESAGLGEAAGRGAAGESDGGCGAEEGSGGAWSEEFRGAGGAGGASGGGAEGGAAGGGGGGAGNGSALDGPAASDDRWSGEFVTPTTSPPQGSGVGAAAFATLRVDDWPEEELELEDGLQPARGLQADDDLPRLADERRGSELDSIDGLEESVSTRRLRYARRSAPPAASGAVVADDDGDAALTGGASPRHEVSLKSPQSRAQRFASGCVECEVLRRRVAELEDSKQALEGALEARAMATLAARAKGASPRAPGEKARLREECDSLRLTVDFRTFLPSAAHRDRPLCDASR